MPSWLTAISPSLRRGVPALLTLVALAGVALCGAHFDWALPPSLLGGGPAAAERGTSEPAARVTDLAEAAGGPRRIEFASAEAVEKAGIRCERARVQPVAQYVTANGMVDYEPSYYARLTARASGTVARVYKEVGAPLRKGDVLALIDAAEVGKAKADFLQALSQVQVQAAALQRLRSAGEAGAVPDRSVRTAEASLREARIRLFNDQQALLNLGLPIRLRDVEDLPEDRLARHLRFLGLPEDITKELDPETSTANLLPLTAPFDGVVVQRDVAPGEVIQGTMPKTLFVVADVRRLHVDLNVPPGDMAGVRVGQKVKFRTDGGVEAVAQVSHISPEVDEKTRRVVVHAEVDNTDGLLRPNAFGTGDILIREVPQAVVVPREAVQADGSVSLVFVRRNATTFEARPVEPGLPEGGVIEVKGLDPGQEVVTTGSFALKSELLKERITGGDEP
jgi:cobalt-zinc-cadmium efflux system membrane fusion protein